MNEWISVTNYTEIPDLESIPKDVKIDSLGIMISASFTYAHVTSVHRESGIIKEKSCTASIETRYHSTVEDCEADLRENYNTIVNHIRENFH